MWFIYSKIYDYLMKQMVIQWNQSHDITSDMCMALKRPQKY